MHVFYNFIISATLFVMSFLNRYGDDSRSSYSGYSGGGGEYYYVDRTGQERGRPRTRYPPNAPGYYHQGSRSGQYDGCVIRKESVSHCRQKLMPQSFCCHSCFVVVMCVFVVRNCVVMRLMLCMNVYVQTTRLRSSGGAVTCIERWRQPFTSAKRH